MVKEFIFLIMVVFMKVNFLKMKKMEMEYLNILLETYIKEIIKMGKKVDLEFIITKKLKMFMKVKI